MMTTLPKNARPTLRVSAWGRFWKNRTARAGALLLALLVAICLSLLPFSVHWYNVQAPQLAVRHPPSARAVVPYGRFAEAIDREQFRGKDHAQGSQEASSTRNGVNVVRTLAHRASSWLGHDDLGRSLFYRLNSAFAVSLAIGLAAACVAAIIGTLWGAIAAIFGGVVDLVMMRIVDMLFGLPYILMVILLKIALTPPLTVMFAGHAKYADLVILLAAISGVSWLTLARVVRGQVLSLREQGYVEAARAAGAGRWHILRYHLVPNLVGPITVYATLAVPQAIMQESFLSFLGIGVQPPVPSLGSLAADGVEAVNTFVDYWWLLVFPCGLLVIVLLALNFIGDGLREALDPKSTQATLV